MKAISDKFKETLTQFGREYKNVIDVYDNLLLSTQKNDILLTENDLELIAKTSNEDISMEIDDENIYSIKLIRKGEILSTLMKEIDFESSLNLDKGSVINYKFGLKTSETSDIEANNWIKDILTNASSIFYKKYLFKDLNENNFEYYSQNGWAINFYNLKNLTNDDGIKVISDEDYLKLEEMCDFQSTIARVYPFALDIDSFYVETKITMTYSQYEYLDFGRFIIYKKEFNQDTKNYTYICYDFMLKTMIMIGNEFNLNNTSNSNDILLKICETLGIDFDTSTSESDDKPTPYGMIKNLNYNINLSTILENKITYRDLLNYLCQYLGVSMYMENNELKLKLLGEIKQDGASWIIDNENPTLVDTINKNFMKDKNVAFKSIYGPINSLTITGTDENKQKYIEDTSSVETNGLTTFQIEKNILINDTTIWDTYGNDIAQNIFDLINGVNFELYDVSTIGILYLDWLDYFNVEIDNTTYKCLLLNSEITIKSGISEDIYTDLPEKNVSEYTTSDKSNDIIGDTIRARGNAYANGERLVQESEINNFFPINKVEVFFDNLDHSNFLGFTWELISKGQFPIGYNPNDSDFNVIGRTGGEKTHTLTVNEMPRHSHTASNKGFFNTDNYTNVTARPAVSRFEFPDDPLDSNRFIIGETGGSQAHNNMPPYIVMAFWRRII